MVHFCKAWLTVQIQPNCFNNILNLYHQITKRKYIFTVFDQIFCLQALFVSNYASMIFYISVGRSFDI